MPRKRSSEELQTAFGARLEAARKAAGLSMQALSDATGCPQSTLSTAERSGNGSSYTARIARACGVNAYWLETGEGEMHATDVPAAQAGPSAPAYSPEGENLAAEFDEAPLGRSSRAQVHRLCLAIILYGGLPPYTDLVNVKLQSTPAAPGSALPGVGRQTQKP
jgi:transcriptional regulator with XRE-family HTH domain